mmetsp:Transcript_206/g.646  ORF Transcript_206/g.646 Transcript_206/m.646 type:complete len:241 (-) Transcript_206:201-923(-)
MATSDSSKTRRQPLGSSALSPGGPFRASSGAEDEEAATLACSLRTTGRPSSSRYSGSGFTRALSHASALRRSTHATTLRTASLPSAMVPAMSPAQQASAPAFTPRPQAKAEKQQPAAAASAAGTRRRRNFTGSMRGRGPDWTRHRGKERWNSPTRAGVKSGTDLGRMALSWRSALRMRWNQLSRMRTSHSAMLGMALWRALTRFWTSWSMSLFNISLVTSMACVPLFTLSTSTPGCLRPS